MKYTSSPYHFLLFCALLPIFLIETSCASLTGYQTARTAGKNQWEAINSINFTQIPNSEFPNNLDTSDNKPFFFPNFESTLRYGIAERWDIGLKLTTNFNLAADVKFQFIGNQTSKFAMATGFSIGSFGYLHNWNLQVPLYISIHPKENISIYLNPRYTAELESGYSINIKYYYGGNIGILFGESTQFGIDAGLHNYRASDNEGEALLTFGIGLKKRFSSFGSLKWWPKRK
jgi:hypothetical protein